jgi:small subunit ribosomal protein S9
LANNQLNNKGTKQMVKETEKIAKKTASKASLAHGVGRRKAAIARVWLKRGSGKIEVNDVAYEDYFDTEVSRHAAKKPFLVYPQAAKLYDVGVNLSGGGLRAQADALKLGLTRALCQINPEIKSVFRTEGLLTVDSRVKERKKYGQKAARRKFQFVKR